MSRWFRWYDGTSEDGKFRMVARNAGVTVAVTLGVWAMILEDASHPEHRGVATKGEDFYCPVLGIEFDEIVSILSAMETAGLISVGHGEITVNKWKERQFETDGQDHTNAARQKRWRDRQKANVSNNGRNVTDNDRNVTVTETKRPDTETETEKKDSREAIASLVNGVAVDLTRKRIERSQSDQALLDRITDRWNAWAKPRGLSAVALLTAQRSTHCRRRVADLQALTGDETPEAAFDKLLAKCDASFFIRGSPRSKLRFDQLMREGFMAQMMENGFENQERKQSWQR